MSLLHVPIPNRLSKYKNEKGLLARGITEIVGESASAKTQFCLQLTLSVQLPLAGGIGGGGGRVVSGGGLGGGAAFVSTEDAFPNKRMQQMMEHFVEAHPSMQGMDLGSNIYVEHASTVDDLLRIVSQRVPLLLRQGVRLVIIDSVAALFRVEFDRENSAKRATFLFKLGECQTTHARKQASASASTYILTWFR